MPMLMRMLSLRTRLQGLRSSPQSVGAGLNVMQQRRLPQSLTMLPIPRPQALSNGPNLLPSPQDGSSPRIVPPRHLRSTSS